MLLLLLIGIAVVVCILAAAAAAVGFLGAIVVMLSYHVFSADDFEDYASGALWALIASVPLWFASVYLLRLTWSTLERVVERYWQDQWDRRAAWKAEVIGRCR
ncbi:MAG: hypothetical protein CMJ18_19335 [Phycisphaeraceae bacterium]|nr:hypothetical protein [Phycisphaeraceae bacterium]